MGEGKINPVRGREALSRKPLKTLEDSSRQRRKIHKQKSFGQIQQIELWK